MQQRHGHREAVMTHGRHSLPIPCQIDTSAGYMEMFVQKSYTQAMSVETVRNYLRPFGYGDKVIEFSQSSATVKEAAADLGTEEGRIAKSMSFMTSSGPIIIVLAGDRRIDNRKFKDTFSEKARMIGPDDVEALTGHPVGGVCPFAAKEGVRVYLDQSLKDFGTVFPAAGSRNSAIEMTPDELGRVARPTAWIDVSKKAE